MSDNVIQEPARSLKEQFSRGSEAWNEQSDPTFRFWTEGDCWGFPLFSLSASRYFGTKETLCRYWRLGAVVITGPKVLDFYAWFCAHRATRLKSDGKDIKVLNLILSGDSDGVSNRTEIRPLWSYLTATQPDAREPVRCGVGNFPAESVRRCAP
jgi:hypothetical protein